MMKAKLLSLWLSTTVDSQLPKSLQESCLAFERAAHVYQNVSVHMDSGSCPQGEVFWPN